MLCFVRGGGQKLGGDLCPPCHLVFFCVGPTKLTKQGGRLDISDIWQHFLLVLPTFSILHLIHHVKKVFSNLVLVTAITGFSGRLLYSGRLLGWRNPPLDMYILVSIVNPPAPPVKFYMALRHLYGIRRSYVVKKFENKQFLIYKNL